MIVRSEQFPKAPSSTIATESGILTDKPEQPEKALYPIKYTFPCILTNVKLEQFSKAEFPIIVTEVGISIEVKPEQ